jgi:hypothetical protein
VKRNQYEEQMQGVFAEGAADDGCPEHHAVGEAAAQGDGGTFARLQ